MGLREFMRFLLQQSSFILKSPNLAPTLAKIAKIPATKVYEYLDKLDLKYIKVTWSGGGRPLGIEILRDDFDSIPKEQAYPQEAATAKAEVRKTGRLGICQTCGDEKKIMAKNKCSGCYQKATKIQGMCVVCGHEKNIMAKGKCGNCYLKANKKVKICVGCHKEKPIQAKNKCSTCYHRD